MSSALRTALLHTATLLFIFIFASVMFFTGINWGLPSRDADPFLFGARQPWTGRQIMDLAGAWDTSSSRGADIAMHPLAGRAKPVVLNDTDAKRAEIVRRYRLYSKQPDEMITFRSLSGMKPGKLEFDPKMYQYGGLWVYPIGGLLKLAGLIHLITLRTDPAFYLDHPEAFARFYLLARGYSAMWGLIGVLVVFAVGREWSGRFFTGAAAAALYVSMPVVIDLAHEAKPHLAGTVLTLLAVYAGMRYVRTGIGKWWVFAGLFAGSTMGMVLTGYAAFAVLPVMTLLRPLPWKHRFQITLKAMLIGIAIFMLTNPYLPFNILFRRSVLHSNVGNYGTFYRPAVSLEGLIVAWHSLLEGMSFAPLIVGTIGLAILIRRKDPREQLHVERIAAATPASPSTEGRAKRRRSYRKPEVPLHLLVATGLPVLIQFVLLAAGKTAEYARFGLTLDVILATAAVIFINQLSISEREKNFAAALLVVGTLFFGVRYDINFLLDNRSDSTRRMAAKALQSAAGPANNLAVLAEPAPYCLPPVDLFNWKIILLPPGSDVSAVPTGATFVRPIDTLKRIDPLAPARLLSPISWANKPFEIVTASPVPTPTTRP